MTQLLSSVFDLLSSWIPALVAAAVVSVSLWLLNRFLQGRKGWVGRGGRFAQQILMLTVTAVGILTVVLSTPLPPETRNQLLGLLGLVLTALIAFSSTTIVANAMAGLMLRAVKGFRLGDFITIEGCFGRVTERGLFHTEIQTEDRDLMQIPNAYLVSHPVRVVRTSGTIVSAELSLGYDVPHAKVEPLLVEAALQVDLVEPFVRITELGNYAVHYRVAGMLEDVKLILSTRSHLRARVLDVLHEAGIEIMSPTVMAQRPVPSETLLMPKRSRRSVPEPDSAGTPDPEKLIFDKADEAENFEEAKARYQALLERAEVLTVTMEEAMEESHRDETEAELGRVQRHVARLEKYLATKEENRSD